MLVKLIPLFATSVDPRWHTLKFGKKKFKCEVKLELLRLSTSILQSSQSDREARPLCKKTKTTLDKLLGKEGESTDNCYEAECTEPVLCWESGTDLLQW